MQPVILDCHLNQKEKYFFLPCTTKNTKNRIMHRITGKIGTRSMLILMLMQVPRTGRNHVPICCRKIFTKIYSILKSQGKSADSCLSYLSNRYMHVIWRCLMLSVTCGGEGWAAKEARQKHSHLIHVLRPRNGVIPAFLHVGP